MNGRLTRRDFIKLAQGSFFMMSMLPLWKLEKSSLLAKRLLAEWPSLSLSDLPNPVREIMALVPQTAIDRGGYLYLQGEKGRPVGFLPLATTQWNRERRFPNDRLDPRISWGIVLHWYGDHEDFDHSLTGYLRGFDSLRDILGYMTRTSAHFLVGSEVPAPYEGEAEPPISIIQTQSPDTDGTPFLASHLLQLNLDAHKNKEQYFVRALYQLGYENKQTHNLLQDMFDGPYFDPNTRTIAIEMTGYGFESAETFPPPQQIANAISVVWAAMKRYLIPASHLLGHNEIQLGKADPGKKFMSLIRYLIGVRALLENDDLMRQLVFGQYMSLDNSPRQAVSDYFKFVRDYLVLVGTPHQVFDWETTCAYWQLSDRFSERPWNAGFAGRLIAPLVGETGLLGDCYLIPDNHEGIDLYPKEPVRKALAKVRLAADGECLYAGPGNGYHTGQIALFRHRQAQGTELVTSYNHLTSLSRLQAGETYAQGIEVGEIEEYSHEQYLHFAVAYGSTWETVLRTNPNVPLNVGATWIRQRYMSPDQFLIQNLDKEFEPLRHTLQNLQRME